MNKTPKYFTHTCGSLWECLVRSSRNVLMNVLQSLMLFSQSTHQHIPETLSSVMDAHGLCTFCDFVLGCVNCERQSASTINITHRSHGAPQPLKHKYVYFTSKHLLLGSQMRTFLKHCAPGLIPTSNISSTNTRHSNS